MAVAAGRLCTRGHIQHRAAVKEALGPELEAGRVHRHDGPVLGTREMGQAKGVPENDVLTIQFPVLCHVLRQARSPACWLTKSPVG